jgi:hypothetical protein
VRKIPALGHLLHCVELSRFLLLNLPHLERLQFIDKKYFAKASSADNVVEDKVVYGKA